CPLKTPTSAFSSSSPSPPAGLRQAPPSPHPSPATRSRSVGPASQPRTSYYVAIYSPPSSRNRDFLGYLFLNGSTSWRGGSGELSLPRLPTLRVPYQFRLFCWPANEYSYHHTDH
ncbi:unnamed protein product, partial [Urochloa humidicola]